MHMLPVGIASMLACVASGVPVVGGCWLHDEGAGCFQSVRSFRARYTGEGEIATETALLVDSICPTTKLAEFALGVPIVGSV